MSAVQQMKPFTDEDKKHLIDKMVIPKDQIAGWIGGGKLVMIYDDPKNMLKNIRCYPTVDGSGVHHIFYDGIEWKVSRIKA